MLIKVKAFHNFLIKAFFELVLVGILLLQLNSYTLNNLFINNAPNTNTRQYSSPWLHVNAALQTEFENELEIDLLDRKIREILLDREPLIDEDGLDDNPIENNNLDDEVANAEIVVKDSRHPLQNLREKIMNDGKLNDDDTTEDDQGKSLRQHLADRKGFMSGFIAAFSVILVSEIGDKTFFIAAIMAMRHSRLVVLSGAFGALFVMTFLSAGMGHLMSVIPRFYTFYMSTLLFFIFGIKLLKEATEMDDTEGLDELEEVDQELKLKVNLDSTDAGTSMGGAKGRWIRDIKNGVLLQAFTMTFLAEWGDRSQITTVVLGTREDALAVSLGGSLGHFLCTSAAVIGGRMVAEKISVKTVTFIGGIVFIMFALSSLYFGIEQDNENSKFNVNHLDK